MGVRMWRVVVAAAVAAVAAVAARSVTDGVWRAKPQKVWDSPPADSEFMRRLRSFYKPITDSLRPVEGVGMEMGHAADDAAFFDDSNAGAGPPPNAPKRASPHLPAKPRNPPIAPVVGVPSYFDKDTGRVTFVYQGRPVTGIAAPTTTTDAPPSAAMVQVLNTYPHDTGAFTQGLFIHKGVMYESTGWYGESNVRMVDVKSGKVIKQTMLPAEVFGEGITVHKGKIIGMSWRERYAFVMDPDTLAIEKQTTMPHQIKEGWGIVSLGDDQGVMVSDSTEKMHLFTFDDQWNWQYVKSMTIKDPSQSMAVVPMVNELELVNGKIWGNVIGLDHIAIIDAASGLVDRWIDCDGLWAGSTPSPRGGNDVLNGIAYDSATHNLYVTGKRWDTLYQIDVIDES